MTRKKNPRYRMPTDKARKEAIKNSIYRDRVVYLRPYFGDLFKPKRSGDFDLRHPASEWSAKARKKIDSYWNIIAPQIAVEHKAVRLRRPDRLREAVAFTQQEVFLPGQKAALFPIQKGEKLTVKFSRANKVTIKRGQVQQEKAFFDMNVFIRDPDTAIAEAAAELPEDAVRYKILMGPHQSLDTYESIDDAIEAMHRAMAKYNQEDYDPDDERSSYFGNWLHGLLAYSAVPGSKLEKVLKKQAVAAEKQREAWRKDRAKPGHAVKRTAKKKPVKKSNKKKPRGKR